MTAWRGIRPTWVESALGAVLLCLSLLELFFSDEQPAPTLFRVLTYALPPMLVAFSRAAPEPVAAVAIVVAALGSLEPSSSGTLGSGLAFLAIAFALAAWSPQAWPWLFALIVASTLRDLRTLTLDLADVIVDWAFLGFTVWIGRVVHRRTAQAAELATRLRLADLDRESRTREVVARERALIARELHDIVAHAVSLMVVQAGTARPNAQRVDQELAEVLAVIEGCGREALNELRRLLKVLRSDEEPDLRPLPDLGRLDDLVDGVRSTGLRVTTRFQIPGSVPPGVALCAYRAVQEGLTNAVRYANGAPVDIVVTGTQAALRVEVQDRGGVAQVHQLGAGTGLVGLRERVLLCGGDMTAGPAGPGYLLQVTLPLSGTR